MVNKVAVYNKDFMGLGPVAFVRSVKLHTPICDMPGFEVIKEFAHLFTHQCLAYKIGEDIHQIDKDEIKELVLSRFKRLSINEMYYAFKLHRSGEFGEEISHYGQFTVTFVAKVLRAYVEWKRDVRAKNNIALPQATKSQELSPDEKKQYILKGVMRIFDEYQEHKMLPTGSLFVYDVLYDIGLLPTDPKTKREYYNRAKESVRMQAELDKKRVGVTLYELREIKRVIENIEKKGQPEVIVQAKKDVVCAYFKKTTREKLEKTLKEKI